MRISEEFESVKSLLYHVLKNYPETRNSDTVLYLTCCEVLGAKTIAQAKNLDLNVISVHKIRQVIQNKEGMYLPAEKIAKARKERDEEARQYMADQGRGFELKDGVVMQ